MSPPQRRRTAATTPAGRSCILLPAPADRRSRQLFLAAYACSGAAGLIYEVSWTRLLTLHMGQSTAAASTVVASFMGGLAIGAYAAGRIAQRLRPVQALYGYVLLECLVGLIAVALPYEMMVLTPLLTWAYGDGTARLFPLVRLVSCLGAMSVPAMMLGATFPLAVRSLVALPRRARGANATRYGPHSLDSANTQYSANSAYSANTAGAAIGSLAAGFVMIPLLGIRMTTLAGVVASYVAAGLGLIVARLVTHRAAAGSCGEPVSTAGALTGDTGVGASVAIGAVAISGFAGLLIELVWTRVLSLAVGPTIYALSATLAAFIAGLAGGAALGSSIAARTARPAFWIATAFAVAAIATNVASMLAAGYLPLLTAHQISQSGEAFGRQLPWHAMVAAAAMIPTAAATGVVFPLALHAVTAGQSAAARHSSVVYMANALAAVAGALVAGFVIVPWLGLQGSIRAGSALLIAGGIAVAFWGRSQGTVGVPFAAAGIAVATLVWSPTWNRELLASGAYRYAPAGESGTDLATALTAGRVLFDRDGAAATISVRQLAGNRSLAIDGKVDASNGGDMLTQKLLAHLPLLLHPDPHDICIIGLGSGVTLAAALVHPITRADVVELSPEVVEASRYFAADNRDALADPRTHLLLEDGRTHLQLSSRQYDVIISEPSNPWMIGVAALFTREFFAAARDRLTPGGIICQWAHTYDISDSDLRSIAGTFASVFPDGTMWIVGDSDILFVASTGPLDAHLANPDQTWHRPGVAADLATVAAVEPFALWSAYAGGPAELKTFGEGAAIQRDDRMALEFSGPRSLLTEASGANAARVHRLLAAGQGPPQVRHALETAGVAAWRNRGAMLRAAHEYSPAYESYDRALAIAATDRVALDGLVETAIATHREATTLARFRTALEQQPRSRELWIARSKLAAASGLVDEAIAAAQSACAIAPEQPAAVEQLASVFADLGDAAQLQPVIATLARLAPGGARTLYFSAALRFIRGEFTESLDLLQQTVALAPTDAAAANMLGAVHASLGHDQPAREALQKAVNLNPRDGAIYSNLGLLELSVGRRREAARYFAEALSLDPRSEVARRGLADAR